MRVAAWIASLVLVCHVSPGFAESAYDPAHLGREALFSASHDSASPVAALHLAASQGVRDGARSRDVPRARPSEPTSPSGLEWRIAELESRRDRISFAGPRKVMITGGAFAGAGVLLAAVCLGINAEASANCHPSLWQAGLGAAAGGLGLASIGGLAHLAFEKERRDIDRRILDLQRQRAMQQSPAWSIGLNLGRKKGIRFAWRF